MNLRVHEQVIEVPKISLDRTRQRLGDSLRQPQTAEQLVEVPTIVSYSSLHGNVEQNDDIPVPPVRVGVRGFQGQRPGQDSAAFGRADHVEILVHRRGFDEGLQGFSPAQRLNRSHSSSARWPARPSADFSNPPDTADQWGVFLQKSA